MAGGGRMLGGGRRNHRDRRVARIASTGSRIGDLRSPRRTPNRGFKEGQRVIAGAITPSG
jgi:hypothetical protein